MKLTREQIDSIARGIIGSVEIDGTVRLRRFTEKTFKVFEGTGYEKMINNCAGMTFDFYTDSEYIKMTFSYGLCSTKFNVCMDTYVDDTMIYTADVEAKPDVVDTYEVHFEEGRKHIKVYLPYSMELQFHSVELSDGAYIEPYNDYTKNVLITGDSITHGWHTTFPSYSYASVLTRTFNWRALNQGIAGYYFRATWQDKDLPFKPDLITAAYGANDWYRAQNLDEIRTTVRAYFDKMREIYPNVPILDIVPIWRADKNEDRPCKFEDVRQTIIKEASSYDNVYIVDAYKFVPHLPEFFGDGRLHPNDLGFASYADGVANAIRKFGLDK